MDKLKQWVALTLVGVLAVLAAGWFLLVSPKRSTARDIKAQTAAQESTNSGLRTTLAMLKAQAKDVPRQQAKIAAVGAKIPDNPALPSLIRALDKASADTGVDLGSLSPAPAAAVAAAPAPVAAVHPTTAGATAAARSGAALASAGSLAQIVVTLGVKGSYFQMDEFLDRLENLTRSMKVTAINLAPATDAQSSANQVTANITAAVYMAAGRVPAAPVSIPAQGK